MPTIDLISAGAFSYQELTEAYNHTRVDYMVPMPLNANKLREYVITYDIDMQASVVAVDGYEILGLSMLGVREKRTWITRLGVIRNHRRHGAGTAMMDHLIQESKKRNADNIILEVILNNSPAHSLFKKLGFRETRDLLVLARPPIPLQIQNLPKAKVKVMNYAQVVELLKKRSVRPSWLDETESLTKIGNIEGFYAMLNDGSEGWLVYQNTVFQLGRITIQTEIGDPVQVGRVLLHHLHTSYARKDTKTENLPSDDPHWVAFQEMGYFELFRRVEMILPL